MSTGAGMKRVLAGLLLGSSLVFLVGCGVVDDTLEGLGASGPSSAPPEPSATAEGSIVVTVQIDSDAATATDLAVDIDSPSTPQSLYEDEVQVPFRHDFTVSTDAFFPLRGTTVEVHAAPDATFVSCSITVDGEVVGAHVATSVMLRGNALDDGEPQAGSWTSVGLPSAVSAVERLDELVDGGLVHDCACVGNHQDGFAEYPDLEQSSGQHPDRPAQGGRPALEQHGGVVRAARSGGIGTLQE